MKRSMQQVLGAVAALAVAALGLVAASGSVDATFTKKTYTVASSPAELTATAGQQATITLTNTTKNNILFDAANIVVPAGLQVANPTVVTSTGPKTVTLNTSVSPARLELRGLQVPNTATKNSATLSFTITTAVPANCASYTFPSDVRQSNNFNGTLNKFTRVGADATFTAPCNSSTVTCTAGDSAVCSTGTIVSGSGNEAEVTVEDSDTISGTLTATLNPSTYQCAEYAAASDQLDFDITVTNGAPTSGLTKTVTFSGPVLDARPAYEYQVCFSAPFDFPAQLPSELFQDFQTGDFSGNTQLVGSEYRGLLLPCSAGYDVPCIQSRTISGGRINLTISTAVADPRARY
jgi:hypothetical protein